MSSRIFHVKLMKADGKGNLDVIYPINKAEDVIVPKNTGQIPESMKTLNDVLVNLNPAVFSENLGQSVSNLDNVTNDKQIKGLPSGTTEDHILVFGSDGYSVKDSGYTIESSVPADAKFTDTTYPDASTSTKGIVQLSDSVESTSVYTAATSSAVKRAYDLAAKKVESIKSSSINGAINVDDEDVKITGLKSAAFKEATDFATAEQGKMAGSSIQAIKVGKVFAGEVDSVPDVTATTYDNITTLDFKLPKGTPGTRWYYGNAITGNSTDPKVFIETNIVRALVHDLYLNIPTGCIYECIVEGNNEEAEWVYLTSLKGDVGKGTTWYIGTLITGTEMSGTIFPESGVVDAGVNDYYLNTDNSSIYKCIVPGKADVAEWIYVSTLAVTSVSNSTIPILTENPETDGIWFCIV